MDFLPPFGVARAHELMRVAADLSKSGLGLTWPNPIVGAVICDSAGNILATGFHHGGPHAEINAIAQLQNSLGKNLTGNEYLFITLEPCNHQGKTGPCTHAILNAGIKNVVFSVADPNPTASGGKEFLISNGIKVYSGIEYDYCKKINRAWLHKITNQRPYFVAKIAATIDGKISAADGSSKWITGEEARKQVHLLRSQSDAILTSTKTVIADNPSLNSHQISEHNPERIVIGNSPISADSKILNDGGVTHLLETNNLERLIEFCSEKNYNQVMVEVGAKLLTSLISADLIDEIHLYIAPKLLGMGKEFISDLGITNISLAKSWKFTHQEFVGKDCLLVLNKEDA